SRITLGSHLRFPRCARVLHPPQNLERLVAAERVADVSKIDARDELLRRHVGHQFPHRLALNLRIEIPNRIDDCRRREMNRALLRTDPSELALVRKPIPETAH